MFTGLVVRDALFTSDPCAYAKVRAKIQKCSHLTCSDNTARKSNGSLVVMRFSGNYEKNVSNVVTKFSAEAYYDKAPRRILITRDSFAQKMFW